MRLELLTLITALLVFASPPAPGSSAENAASIVPEIQTDVIYGRKDGLALTMDVYQPIGKANGAAVLYIVSGGWFSRWSPPEERLRDFRPFLYAGYTMFALRHGSSPRYSIAESIDDVQAGVRFLRLNASRFRIDPTRIGAIGNSAGGHLALALATMGDETTSPGESTQAASSQVAAVVALTPPIDLTKAVPGAPNSSPAYRRFPALDISIPEARASSPLFHVSTGDAPTLLIMGDEDPLIPLGDGTRMAQALEQAGVAHKLVIMENAGHDLMGVGNLEMLRDEIIDWFGKHLLQPETQGTQ